MPKYKVGDIIWYIHYLKRRIECSLIHQVIKGVENEYEFGPIVMIRKEKDLYATREEAQIKLDEYLKSIGG